MTTAAPLRPATTGPTWGSDLALGLRLVLSTGRRNRLRLLLSALGVACCVLTLLLVAAVSPSLAARSARLDRLVPVYADDVDSGTFLARVATVSWQGHPIRAVGLDAVSAAAPAPPGLNRFPTSGEVFLSPGLATALRSGNPDLKALVPGTPAGTIDPAALPSPDDWVYYLSTGLPADGARYASWGDPSGYQSSLFAQNPTLAFVLGVGTVILVIPLILFLTLASRVGGPARDRRSAAIRLLGASATQVRRFALAEAAVAALAGTAVGAGLFAGAKGLLPGALDMDLVSADIRVDVGVFVAICLLAPVVLTVVALIGNRNVIVEPLSVSRRARQHPRRWWRVAFLVAAVVISFAVHSDGGGVLPYLITTAAVLLCVPVLIPLVVDLLTSRSRAGGPGLRLALGRLRQDPLTNGRAAAGISVVLAGAICMLSILGQITQGSAARNSGSDRTGTLASTAVADLTAVPAALHTVTGVGPVAVYAGFPLVDAAGNEVTEVTVADCSTITVLAEVTSCAEGQSFSVDGAVAIPSGGLAVVNDNGTTSTKWAPPGGGTVVASRPVFGDAGFPGVTGYLVTPQAAAGLHWTDLSVTASIPADRLAAAQLALAGLGFRGLLVFGEQAAPTLLTADQEFRVLRLALVVASLMTLLVCALGQWVIGAEQLAERRRSLALARAAGVPMRVLIRSIFGAALLPIVVGAVLAVLAGGFVIYQIRRGPTEVQTVATWWSTPAMAVGAVVFVALVAAGTGWRMRRVTGPEAMRTE